MILSTIFGTLNSTIFAIVLNYFLIATMFNHSSLIQCSVIFECYIAQLFCNFATVISTILLNHFVILSTRFCYTKLIHFCYSAKPFFDCYNAHPLLIDTMLSNFLLLQRSVIFWLLHCLVLPLWYNAQSFLVTIVLSYFSLLYCSIITCATVLVLQRGWEATQSGEACVREAAHGSVAGERDWGAWTGHMGPCGTESHGARRPWLDRSVGPLGPGDGPVHHPRWWIAAIHIHILYIY
jgi:hypothetical protein